MVHHGGIVSDDMGKGKQSRSPNKHSLTSLRFGSRTVLCSEKKKQTNQGQALHFCG